MTVTIISTDFGDVRVPAELVEKLARVTKRGTFDRRYKTAARDERFVAMVKARARSEWERA